MQIIESIGEGKYFKECLGCKKPFRTDARNARYAPAEVCRCLEKKAKARTKRARERRQYHRDPERFQNRSRVRAEARKIMESYLRSNGLEPGCAFPGCDKHGWEFWTGTLQVHHTWGGDIPPNPPKDEEGNHSVLAYLAVACRSHHDLFDQCIEKRYLPALYRPDPPNLHLEMHTIRIQNPKRFWRTPHSELRLEILS